MSKHRLNIATETPEVFASPQHVEQVVSVEHGPDDLIHVTLTAAAAVEFATILVEHRTAARLGRITSSAVYDADLWRDVGQEVTIDALKATTSQQSRYVAPRPANATGRVRRGLASLTGIGGPA